MSTAVLIPLFNHESYIALALDSIAAQTRPPEFVIVIDDGSTDGSAHVVQEWIEQKGKSAFEIELHIQENAGAHATLNRGIDLAIQKGCEFISILNSDDLYTPKRLEEGIEFLKSNPDLSLICTRLEMVDELGQPLNSTNYHAIWLSSVWSIGQSSMGENLPKWLGYGNFVVTTSNFIARTQWLKENRFMRYRYAHDYAMLVRAALTNQLGVLHSELLKYRVHSRNTMKTNSAELIKELVQLNVDLAAELAPKLIVDPGLRAAYSEYRQSSWQNVSAFRADLFELVVAQTFADQLQQNKKIVELPDELEELHAFRNLSLANLGNQTFETLVKDKDLLLEQLKKEKLERQSSKELRDLQLQLMKSRWFAFGRVLNLREVNWILQSGGKGAFEKLTTIKYRLAASWWVQWGRRLGSKLQTLQIP